MRARRPADRERARRLVAVIARRHRVTVSSAAGVAAVRACYRRAPLDVRARVEARAWELEELAAVARALGHFAPLLGDARGRSARRAQAVRTVSKLDRSIDVDAPRGRLDRSALAEYFDAAGNVSFFTAGTRVRDDFRSARRQLEGTAVHELAHAFLDGEAASFVAATPYWRDLDTPSRRRGAEPPATRYGRSSAREDLCEAAMLHFVAPRTLAARCPERHAFFTRLVASWRESAVASRSVRE